MSAAAENAIMATEQTIWRVVGSYCEGEVEIGISGRILRYWTVPFLSGTSVTDLLDGLMNCVVR